MRSASRLDPRGHGREELFGPDPRFFPLKGKKGTAVDQSLVLEFKKERNRIVEHALLKRRGISTGIASLWRFFQR